MIKPTTMTLVRFQKRFHSEEACHEYLYQLRWPDGFRCPRCNHDRAYAIKKRQVYQCVKCNYQVSVTAGTIMHKTRTPLTKWFFAIYLVAHDKRGVSAAMLARELEVSYPTAWLVLHKIRKAMGDRDARYLLAGIVEMDETFFGGPTEGGKRGRGSAKTPVLVSLSLNESGNPRYVKMRVVDNMKSDTIVDIARQTILSGARIVTDLYSSYNALNANGYEREAQKFDPKENVDHLNWIHTVISTPKPLLRVLIMALVRNICSDISMNSVIALTVESSPGNSSIDC